MKKFNEFINEDLRSKNIRAEVVCNNLKSLYPNIKIKYNNDFKIVISRNTTLILNKAFYTALKKDHINKDDIIFENCNRLSIYHIDGFTKVSNYGSFGSGIKKFNCSNCENLTSLQGAPQEVGGNFSCSHCSNLNSLEGSPKTVGGDFSCYGCDNLTSLDGAPENVTGSFDCSSCKNLTSLGGSPDEVGRDFKCWGCEALTSLQGAPKIVKEGFYCAFCYNLTSLDGAPRTIGGDFNCNGCDSEFIKLAIEKYGNKVVAIQILSNLQNRNMEIK